MSSPLSLFTVSDPLDPRPRSLDADPLWISGGCLFRFAFYARRARKALSRPESPPWQSFFIVSTNPTLVAFFKSLLLFQKASTSAFARPLRSFFFYSASSHRLLPHTPPRSNGRQVLCAFLIIRLGKIFCLFRSFRKTVASRSFCDPGLGIFFSFSER